jgi:hypothetical protein
MGLATIEFSRAARVADVAILLLSPIESDR